MPLRLRCEYPGCWHKQQDYARELLGGINSARPPSMAQPHPVMHLTTFRDIETQAYR